VRGLLRDSQLSLDLRQGCRCVTGNQRMQALNSRIRGLEARGLDPVRKRKGYEYEKDD
jgi:hypothetical protein